MSKELERKEREERAARLVAARKAAGYTSAVKAAEAFGWNVNSYKAHEAGRNGFGIADARSYAEAFGTTPELLNFGNVLEASELRRSARSPGTAPIVAVVEAGAWREVDELNQDSGEWVTVPADDKYPDATQRVYDVSGDSMNKLDPIPITNGSRIVAVDYDEIASRVPLRDGLIVVVQRARNGGQERELTVKQVAWFDDRIEFQPRSTNSKHKPIVVQHDSWEDNGVEIAVVGLVRDIIHRLPG